MTKQRKLAAVMFTDIAGYTTLMSKDEHKALALLRKNRDLQQSLAQKYNGEFLKEMGDGTLLCFQSALDAVRCAVEIQKSVHDDPDLNLRIGIHLGDIVFKDGDVFGDGVNVASRIEALAKAGGICISEEVYRSVRNQPGIETVYVGEKSLKNVDHPVKIYLIQEVGTVRKSKYEIVRQDRTEEKSIIVLPFENMSSDSDQEYFSDGITEEIITDLSHVHELLVISRSSAMTFKGTNRTIPEIADRVNVRYVLEGSVRKAGNNLRITAQLIDAATDAHLWAEKYSGTLDDVFDIQEKVSRSIVDALEIRLTLKEDTLISEKPMDNVHAYECYLRARQEIWRLSEESLERALQLLQNGIDLIGENELLLAGMATVYFFYFNWGFKFDECYLEKSEAYIHKIFYKAPDSSHGNALNAMVTFRRGKAQEAVRSFRKALEMDPNNLEGLIWAAYVYAFAGKGEAAQILVQRSVRIDPLGPVIQGTMGMVPLLEGDFKTALKYFKRSYRMEPENPLCSIVYAKTLSLDKQYDEANSLFDLIAEKWPNLHYASEVLFLKYALQGKKGKAVRTVTQELKNICQWDPQGSWWMAGSYSLIDEKEEALNWLEIAVNRGFYHYHCLKEHSPFLENIRGEERFKKLMKRVKKEWENFEV